MTSGHSYSLTVRTENNVPADVLVEHLAVALRSFHFLSLIGITIDSVTHPEETMTRNHPFEGPEVFDDEPKPASGSLASGGYVTGTHGEGSFTEIHEGYPPSYPRMTEKQRDYLIELAKKAVRVDSRKGDDGQVTAELSVIDPYPVVTEAAFQLQQARRDAQR